MPSDSQMNELRNLVSLLLDDLITDTQQVRLQHLLTESKANRIEFLQLTQMEALLHWESSDTTFAEETKNKLTTPVPFPFWMWTSSIAAVLVAMFGALSIFEASHFDRSNASDTSYNAPRTDLALTRTYEGTVADLSESKEVSHRSKPFELLDPYKLSSTAALDGLRALSSRHASPELGVIENHGLVKRWNRASLMSVPSENGILPFKGTEMIALQDLHIDVEANHARGIETVQVVDFRKLLKESQDGHPAVTVKAKFNQSFGESQEAAEFGISLQAFREANGEFTASSDLVFVHSPGDLDARTWNSLESTIELSEDTEFLVISLITSKEGPDALLANTCKYYSDDLEVTLIQQDQSVIGPI